MMNKIALALAVLACACGRPNTVDAQLAQLPHKVVAPLRGGFTVRFAPDGENCGELDPSKTEATLNGQPLGFRGTGGADLTVKGRWQGTCSDIGLAGSSTPPTGTAVLELRDASQTLTAAWDAFGDARTLSPDFDGGVVRGQVVHFALSPASDTLLPPQDGGYESTRAELDDGDGGYQPVALELGEHGLQVTIPADAASGPATLTLRGVASQNPPTRCEGFEACAPDVHSLDARIPLTVVP